MKTKVNSRSSVRLHLLGIILLGAVIGISACNLSAEPPTSTAEQPPPTPEPFDLSQLRTGDAMAWFDYNILVYHTRVSDPTESQGVIDPQVDSLPADFWINRYNVTNDMYRRCVEAGVCTPPAEDVASPSADPELAEKATPKLYPELKDNPVVQVTFEQAKSYCNWMDLRLPSSAEWEFAAVLNEGNSYPWGEAEPSCELANFENCLGTTSGIMDRPKGQSSSSVFDMAGNVRNWTDDGWIDVLSVNSGVGEHPNIRGSSFKDSPESLVVIAGPAFDASSPPDSANTAANYDGSDGEYADDLGFRCAMAGPGIQGTQAAQDALERDLLGFLRFCQLPTISGIPQRPACALPLVAQASSICHDPNSNTGAVYVVFEEQGDVVSSISGPGCYPEPVPGATGLTNTSTYCIGPQLSDVIVNVCSECTPEIELTDNLCTPESGCLSMPLGINCPEGWIEDRAGECRRVIPPRSPLDNRCPSGYQIDPQTGCCDLPAARNHCFPGFSFDSSTSMCISDPGLYPPIIQCQLYEFELGFCSDKQQQQEGAACNVTCKAPKTLQPDCSCN